MLSINEVVSRIKAAGARKVRMVPMANQPVNGGLYQIELNTDGQWISEIAGVTQQMAESIIRQGTNKVICG